MDLAKRAAELFSEKPWKHDYKPTYLDTRWPNDEPKYIAKCKKCQHGLLAGETSCKVINFSKHIYTPNKPSDCPTPDPIDITDLGKALEAYRKHKSSDVGIRIRTRFRVYCDAKGLDYETEKHDGDAQAFRWLVYEATAEQIWEICILAKESEK